MLLNSHYVSTRGFLTTISQFDSDCSLVQGAGSEAITRLAYHEGILIGCSGDHVVFWTDDLNCGRCLWFLLGEII